jgi:hypothetical protein
MGKFAFNFMRDGKASFVANNRIEALDGKDAQTLVWPAEQRAEALAWRKVNKAKGGILNFGKQAEFTVVRIESKKQFTKTEAKTGFRHIYVTSGGEPDAQGKLPTVRVNMWESNLNYLVEAHGDIEGVLDFFAEGGETVIGDIQPGKLPNGKPTVSTWVSHLAPSTGLLEASGFGDGAADMLLDDVEVNIADAVNAVV